MSISRRGVVGLGGALGLTAALQGAASKAAPSNGGKVRTIPMEEACLPEEVLPHWLDAGGYYTPEWKAGLIDFSDKKLEQMDRNGIETMIVSLTVPGPQGQPDRAEAEDMARRGNDALAKAISAHPKQFVGLGCLSMHDVDAACREFERVVKTLRMPGVLLNSFQLVGDERGALFYDQPEYDAFWATAQKLDAPVYLHPGPNARGMLDIKGWSQIYAKFPWLHSAAWFWGVETGSHALRIITSGVFDRFPKAQLILGHNGEHIVHEMWRLDQRIKHMPLQVKVPAKQPVRSYFKSNVQVTTSGVFSDFALRHIIQEIGVDRVLFAIDTPYEHMEEGAAWFDTADISAAERQAIARGNAIRLLKLPMKA